MIKKALRLLLYISLALATLLLLVYLGWHNRQTWLGVDVLRVQSVSMQPALQPNDVVIVNLRAYRHALPQAGDIVVFKSPADPATKWVKRIAYVPGQSVRYTQATTQADATTRLPVVVRTQVTLDALEGYFVLGDNPIHSTDSRVFGPVPLSSVIGKVVYSKSGF